MSCLAPTPQLQKSPPFDRAVLHVPIPRPRYVHRRLAMRTANRDVSTLPSSADPIISACPCTAAMNSAVAPSGARTFRIRRRLQQRFDQQQIALVHGVHQRRSAPSVARVDVHTGFECRRQAFDVARLRGVGARHPGGPAPDEGRSSLRAPARHRRRPSCRGRFPRRRPRARRPRARRPRAWRAAPPESASPPTGSPASRRNARYASAVCLGPRLRRPRPGR